METWKTLINFNFREAPKGVLCYWKDRDDGREFLGYIIPKYIITAIFDDGTMRIAGIRGMWEFNQLCQEHLKRWSDREDTFDEELNGLLCYDVFAEYVDLDMAKGFVQYDLVGKTTSNYNVSKAKNSVLKDLRSCGIEIEQEALEYLNPNYHAKEL